MDEVEKAFRQTDRAGFVPTQYQADAGVDAPLPIGFGQTISQPTTVRLMLEWLEVEPGNKILDIGSGSGWTTALLSRLTGPKGRVYAVERIPELVEFGRDNCQRAGIKNARFFLAGERYGLPKFAPYERILVSAAAGGFPDELTDQLAPGGKLVIPVKNDILEVEKAADGTLETNVHPGFVFVPLVAGPEK